MWGLKKCNNSGRSWMCNRQKLNENQMCNKLNVCGIAHLYHIVQFTCILGSEPTTWALCTAWTASLNITQNASAHIWKTIINSSVFTIKLKCFLLVQRQSGYLWKTITISVYLLSFFCMWVSKLYLWIVLCQSGWFLRLLFELLTNFIKS